MKVLFIIYADLESFFKKISTCYNNPEKSPSAKINKHTPSVIYCLQVVHLIQQKTNLIVKEVKTVWKDFVKI